MAMLGRTGESGMTAFTQIRQQFSAFHLAMIPIGYVRCLLLFRNIDIRIGRIRSSPFHRKGLSKKQRGLHIARRKMHISKDISAKKAVTMHWG